MRITFLFFALTGLAFFYFQELVLFPYIHLRLVDLLLFYLGLRPSFFLASAVALALGFLQDTYAATPFGLHVGSLLLLVGAARFLRRRLLLQRAPSQMAAVLVALILQEIAFRVTLFLVGYRNLMPGDLAVSRSIEILGTVILAPVVFSGLRALERLLSRYGWRIKAVDSG